MHSFIIVDQAGVIVRSGSVFTASDIAIQDIPSGHQIIAGQSGRPSLDRWNGESVEPIPESESTLEERKAAVLSRLAERRWLAETGGIEAGGHRVETDDRSKLLIVNAAKKAREDANFTVKWKVGPGCFIELGSAEVVALEAAVFEHVRQCFTREAELSELVVAAGDVAAIDALSPMIEAFWSS